jgi:O-antigen/teichoic acid export membrane protein
MREFGINAYIVQEKELTPSRLNAAASMNFMISWSMAVVVWVAAPYLARFYGHDGVAEVMRVLAVNYALGPFGAVYAAWMQREMQFGKLAIINVSSALVSAIGSVALAYAGFSYMSMAWSNIFATVVSVSLVWWFKPADLRFGFGLSEIGQPFRFGGLMTLTAFAREACNRLPDMLLGRLISIESVAYFSRAGGLIELFNRVVLNAVTAVALPHFSAKVRQQADLEATYLQAMTYITAMGWPFLVVLSQAAPTLVPLLYGGQWNASIPLVQILCLGEMLLVPFYLQSQVLIAQGNVAVDTRLTFLVMLVRLPLLTLLAPFGLRVVVIGYAMGYSVTAIASYIITRRVIGCSAQVIWNTLRPSLFLTLGVVMAVAIGSHVPLPPRVQLALMTAMAALAWIVGVQILKHPFSSELNRVARRFKRSS